MSATILLARHASHDEVGRVLSGRSAIALNARGRGEAAWLAQRLEGVDLRAIHTSPRPRAAETARIVAGARPVETMDALDEIDFGEWTGRAFADLDGTPAWDRWNAERATARVPGGETMDEAVGRARAHVEAAAAEGGTTLCVTHCDVIRGLVAAWIGCGYGRMLDLGCDPASLTTVTLERGHARLVAMNERPWMDGAKGDRL